MKEVIEVIAGKYKKEITLDYRDSRIWLTFGFNRTLINEIKMMEGARWHGYDTPSVKKWSIDNSPRNKFQLEYLQGMNPYAHYDQELIDWISERPLYIHQKEMAAHGYIRHYCIFACEMGTGKTLAAIEVIEHIKDLQHDQEIWYVGPKSGVKAVGRELVKWNANFKFDEMLTYESMRSIVQHWNENRPPPRVVIFDESSKIKTPTTQRSTQALRLANAVRTAWADKGYIILMSGTPAPKTPVDWWHQCEVACPGYLKEGSVGKFKGRLCVIEERESITGGKYPHIVTWLDDENKCNICGELKEHQNHQSYEKHYHDFIKSKNEVQYLYERMKGLVLVKFKKDCIDIPEKQYRIIKVKPTVEILRAAKIIQKKAKRVIEALTLMRELSDGFQYTDRKIGDENCSNCSGTGKCVAYVPKGDVDVLGPNTDFGYDDFEEREVICDNCGGTGKIAKYERATDRASSPKDDVFIEMLDEHEDVGRLIVWGGFTGTVDRLVDISHQYGWGVLRVDGRGYFATTAIGEVCDSDDFLDAMDLSNPRYKELLEKYPKICFVGHPQAGGMALTLTASPTELFYSNCFNGEARMQAEDRFHRMGMDVNRGATVVDLILLPTDQLVLDNLKKKKKLQDLSMGELATAMENVDVRKD